jgi:hypothetical protein
MLNEQLNQMVLVCNWKVSYKWTWCCALLPFFFRASMFYITPVFYAACLAFMTCFFFFFFSSLWPVGHFLGFPQRKTERKRRWCHVCGSGSAGRNGLPPDGLIGRRQLHGGGSFYLPFFQRSFP